MGHYRPGGTNQHHRGKHTPAGRRAFVSSWSAFVPSWYAFVPSWCVLEASWSCAEDRLLESACQFVPEGFRLPPTRGHTMKLIGPVAVVFALVMSVALAAQSGGGKPQVAEAVFTNIQVLKGIPVDDFMGTMGIMSAALGFCCSECHTGAGATGEVGGRRTPRKRTQHTRMVTGWWRRLTRRNFGGRQVVTCWTCHRGRGSTSHHPGSRYRVRRGDGRTPMTSSADLGRSRKAEKILDEGACERLRAGRAGQADELRRQGHKHGMRRFGSGE